MECTGCRNVISEKRPIGVPQKPLCFRCVATDSTCLFCGLSASGPTIICGEHKFHPECFFCITCASFIGESETYVLLERSKLYCGQCYRLDQESNSLTSEPSTSSTKMHSIRLIEIPIANKENIRLSVEDGQDHDPAFQPSSTVRISEALCSLYGHAGKYFFSFLTNAFKRCRTNFNNKRLDMNAELMSLHVGDRVIEINGQTVRNNSFEDIRKLIQETDHTLQLTIEHDPTDYSTSSSTDTPKYSKDKLSGNLKEPILRKSKNLNCNNSTNSLKDKERSSSMSKLLDERCHQHQDVSYDLSRTKSFRVEQNQGQQRIFRASDLIQGELLGKGFFGQVFKVTHKVTGEVMVLKELYRVDIEAQNNFLKEVSVLRSLFHKNVLRFIGVLYKEKKLHLITEYISGGSLKSIIHNPNFQPLAWSHRISFARDISAGMNYLHKSNVIHRDLNSLNCLVREDKTIVVADFGLARIINQPFLSMSKYEKWAQNGTGTITKKGRQRRQRYTVVGNPWYMAPEMMSGHKYDEKVDIFSFGVILCEIIGRVEADPDFLPRTDSFGLNQKVFKENFCFSCPEAFYLIAFLCCELNADKRPQFELLEEWLGAILFHVSMDRPVPSDLLFDIQHYKGNQSYDSSLCTTPDAGKIDSLKSPDFLTLSPACSISNTLDKSVLLHDCVDGPSNEPPSICYNIPTTNITLSKDFSPNGDRIRDSLRARRKQKILLNRENQRKSMDLDTNSQLQKCSAILSKSIENKPYNKEGYIIGLSQGMITLNNVNELDSCSDFDSSCDTSLNWDVNLGLTEKSPSTDKEQENIVPTHVNQLIKNIEENLAINRISISKDDVNISPALSPTAQKCSLPVITVNEVDKTTNKNNNNGISGVLLEKPPVPQKSFREKLNLYKNKPSKNLTDKVVSKTSTRTSMFSRINPLASPNVFRKKTVTPLPTVEIKKEDKSPIKVERIEKVSIPMNSFKRANLRLVGSPEKEKIKIDATCNKNDFQPVKPKNVTTINKMNKTKSNSLPPTSTEKSLKKTPPAVSPTRTAPISVRNISRLIPQSK